MNFIVSSVVLFAIICCASSNKVTLWGNVTNTLIARQFVNAPSGWFMIVSRTVALDAVSRYFVGCNSNWKPKLLFNFKLFFYFTWQRVKIAGIEIIDNLERSSTFSITRGGICAKKASIQIDSARGAGISVIINFYAQKIVPRHMTRKNKIVFDTAKKGHWRSDLFFGIFGYLFLCSYLNVLFFLCGYQFYGVANQDLYDQYILQINV